MKSTDFNKLLFLVPVTSIFISCYTPQQKQTAHQNSSIHTNPHVASPYNVSSSLSHLPSYNHSKQKAEAQTSKYHPYQTPGKLPQFKHKPYYAFNNSKKPAKYEYLHPSGGLKLKPAGHIPKAKLDYKKLDNRDLKVVSANTENIEKTKSYTIQEGDSLWKISKKFGIPISKIRELNDLTSDRIYPGQEIDLLNMHKPN